MLPELRWTHIKNAKGEGGAERHGRSSFPCLFKLALLSCNLYTQTSPIVSVESEEF